MLFGYISRPYDSGSLIFTSNQPFSHRDPYAPDALIIVAAIDRIIKHAMIFEIVSNS